MPAIASTSTATPLPIAIFFPVLIVPLLRPVRISMTGSFACPGFEQGSHDVLDPGATGDTSSDTRLRIQKFQWGQPPCGQRLRAPIIACTASARMCDCDAGASGVGVWHLEVHGLHLTSGKEFSGHHTTGWIDLNLPFGTNFRAKKMQASGMRGFYNLYNCLKVTVGLALGGTKVIE